MDAWTPPPNRDDPPGGSHVTRCLWLYQADLFIEPRYRTRAVGVPRPRHDFSPAAPDGPEVTDSATTARLLTEAEERVLRSPLPSIELTAICAQTTDPNWNHRETPQKVDPRGTLECGADGPILRGIPAAPIMRDILRVGGLVLYVAAKAKSTA